ncbi:MAG: ribosomal-processing cysteine protease Prp [Bacilli bacterium]
MIRIKIIKDKLFTLEVKGHANYDEIGKDIVCAGVSAVICGGFNSIENSKGFEMIMDEGYSLLKAKEPISLHDEIVIETMINGLKNIAKSYPKNVTIIYS